MAYPQYAQREQVKAALDVKETSRNNAQVDRVLLSSSRSIEGQLGRRFYPWTGTRVFGWPDVAQPGPGRLWLGRNEVISVATLSAGGVVIAPTDYFLEPANDGPPFRSIEIDRESAASFMSLPGTSQRSIAVTGVFGFTADEVSVGSLGGALGALASDVAPITWTTARFGVGDILRIDNERVIITERTMTDTGQNLGGAGMAASNNVSTVAVTNGAAFAIDETILIDSERMLVVDIAGNNLVVRRATDGSTLAAHSAGADIYGLTGVELARGQLGTVAASHLNGAAIYRHMVPPLINDLCVAEALVQLQQEGSAYGRTVGSGETEREATGRGLNALREQARQAYGIRVRAVAV